jgi:hypothetical protein
MSGGTRGCSFTGFFAPPKCAASGRAIQAGCQLWMIKIIGSPTGQATTYVLVVKTGCETKTKVKRGDFITKTAALRLFAVSCELGL